MSIRISENSKRKHPQGPGNYQRGNNMRKDNKGPGYQDMHGNSKSSKETSSDGIEDDFNDRRGRDMEYQDNRHHRDQRDQRDHRDQRGPRDRGNRRDHRNQRDQRDQRDYNRQQDYQNDLGDPRMKQDSYGGGGYSHNRGGVPQYDEPQRMINQPRSMSNTSPLGQQSYISAPIMNSRQPQHKMKSMSIVHGQEPQSYDQLNNSLDMHQSPNEEVYLINDVMPNSSMSEMMPMNNPSEGGVNMSHLDQYVLPQNPTNSVEPSVMNSNPNYISTVGGVQSVPMNNVIVPPNSNSGGRVSVQYNQMPSSPMPAGWNGANTTAMYNNNSNSQSNPSYLDALIDM